MKLCDFVKLRDPNITVFLRNMHFDKVNHKLEGDSFNNLLKKISDIYDAFDDAQKAEIQSGLGKKNVANLFEKSINESGCLFSGEPLFPQNLDGTTAVRVMPTVDFVNYCCKKSGSDIILIDQSSVLTHEHADEEVKRKIARGSTSYINETSLLNSGSGNIWISDKEHFHDNGITSADAVRDELGLAWFEGTETLTMVEFPIEKSLSVKSPTAFDGGLGFIYWSHGAMGEWGQTVKLTDPDTGAPEALSNPVQMEKSFTIHALGQLTIDKPGTPVVALRDKAESYLLAPSGECADLCMLCGLS